MKYEKHQCSKKGKSITGRKHDKAWVKPLTALDHTSGKSKVK
jgi:hypothetical protein